MKHVPWNNVLMFETVNSLLVNVSDNIICWMKNLSRCVTVCSSQWGTAHLSIINCAYHVLNTYQMHSTYKCYVYNALIVSYYLLLKNIIRERVQTKHDLLPTRKEAETILCLDLKNKLKNLAAIWVKPFNLRLFFHCCPTHINKSYWVIMYLFQYQEDLANGVNGVLL